MTDEIEKEIDKSEDIEKIEKAETVETPSPAEESVEKKDDDSVTEETPSESVETGESDVDADDTFTPSEESVNCDNGDRADNTERSDDTENTDEAESVTETESSPEITDTTEIKIETLVNSSEIIYDKDNPVLRVSSLYKSFGRKQVVRGVDFSMKTGEVLGLLGPNGAGKTTTFYMVVGFYKPTSGDVFLNDKCITKLPMFKRARLGISYLPQEPSVFRKFTVEENIWSVLETRKDLSRKEKKQKLEDLIEEFSIGRIRKQKAYTLSGGERRRTEIARSLAIEPKFLLLDEPFAGIDPIAVADIKNVIKLLANRGIGVLITDHNVRDTLEITDRAIIINTGTIMLQGSKEEILASELAREVYLGKNFSM